MTAMDGDAVVRELELEVPAAEVWSALTRPDRLSAWLGGDVSLDVRVGGRGTVRREDGATRRVVVEALEPERMLALRWWPFAEPGAGRPGPGNRVEFLLEPRVHSTVLRVIERAPLPAPAAAEPAGWEAPPFLEASIR
jgi:uncharacterized protein YndB with AHSA1/START domain